MNYVKYKSCILFLLCWLVFLFAQLNSDNNYAKPLKEVLSEIQKKYGVTIKAADSLVNGKEVNYAEWKFRPDVDVTLDNVLKPFELKVRKDGTNQYHVSRYEYYRWPVEEGWAE